MARSDRETAGMDTMEVFSISLIATMGIKSHRVSGMADSPQCLAQRVVWPLDEFISALIT